MAAIRDSYTAKQVTMLELITPESPSGSVAAADEADPAAAAGDDLEREMWLSVPQLRIIGLQMESIGRLVTMKVARIVVFVEDRRGTNVMSPRNAEKPSGSVMLPSDCFRRASAARQ